MQDSFGLMGTTIAEKYRVLEVVGEGGFGLVYRGHHLGFDQPIAVKCLKVPGHFTGEARRQFIEHFAEEGKLLFRLSEHRSIVRVFDHSVIEVHGQQVPYLVLEWLEGISLHDHLEERRRLRLPPMSETEALRLLRDPIDGLAFAHQLRVAHRDIKPENLFLVRAGTGTVTKLLDFGVAKLMEEADAATQYATATSSGFRAFSPQYGAPEQFYSKAFGQTGPWTDVHAIGLLMTELVSSRPAFDGTEFGEVYNKALDAARPTPLTRGAAVTDEFEAICASALALESRNRYRNAGELLTAVDAYLEPADGSKQLAAATPPRRRGTARWVSVGLAGALVAAGVVAAWPSGGTASPRPPAPVLPAGSSESLARLAPELPPQALVNHVEAGTAGSGSLATSQHTDPPAGGAHVAPPTAPPPSPAAPKQLTAPDGAVFRVGDAVFVRRGDAFERGQLGEFADGSAVVGGAKVSLDSISPAEGSAPSWEVGAIALVTSRRRATTYLAKVTALRDSGLMLRLWDGHGQQWARFPDAEAAAGDLTRPIRVRASWQAPLARLLDNLLALADRQRRKVPVKPSTPDPGIAPRPAPPKPVAPSCSDYCVHTAKQELGTPGYQRCLAGCH